MINIQIVTNMNTGFRGQRGLNRAIGVNVGKLDCWINTLCQERSNIIKARPLAGFTLPGSHDAMTYAFKQNWFSRNVFSPLHGPTVTQRLNLVGQFKAGSRYFDLRIKKQKDGSIIGFHGAVDLSKYDAAKEIRDLFSTAVANSEPIVCKFDYKNGAIDAVLAIAAQFSANLMNSSEYWRRSVGDCISAGKLICIFHKFKAKKHGDAINASANGHMFGDYSGHKAGGFTDQHNLKKHKKGIDKVLTTRIAPHEEKLKVMSLNIPCISQKPVQLVGGALSTLAGCIPGLIYRGGQYFAGTPNEDRWIGFYKSVSAIEQEEVVKNINREFANKLSAYVDDYYYVLNDKKYPKDRMDNLSTEITCIVAGVVGMDFIGDKGSLIVQLIELNNRDF